MTVVLWESKQDEPGVLVFTLCAQLAVQMKETSSSGTLEVYMKLLWNSLPLAYKYEISLVWSGVDLVGNKVILPSSEASVLILKQCHLLKLTDTKGPTYWGTCSVFWESHKDSS